MVLLFTGIHLGGPDLTPEHFRDALFAFPPTPSAVTQPSVDYGFGLWTDPNKDEDEYEGDYAGVDDMVELWWTPRPRGPTRSAPRAPACTATSTAAGATSSATTHPTSKVFDRDNSVTEIADPPPAEIPPDYPSPADG